MKTLLMPTVNSKKIYTVRVIHNT